MCRNPSEDSKSDENRVSTLHEASFVFQMTRHAPPVVSCDDSDATLVIS